VKTRPSLVTVWWLVPALAVILSPAHAQPRSALSSGTAVGAPPSALQGSTSHLTTPAPAAQPHSDGLQTANLPADLVRMNDNATVVIGGRQMTAGEVKRAVLSLDDKAIIIIGGKHIAAGELKREIATAGANKPTGMPAPAGRGKAAVHVAIQPITTVSPRRAVLARQLQALREEQDRLANAVGNADPKPNPATTHAGTSVWPQAPLGTKVLETSAGNNSAFGIYAVNGRTKNIQLTPGGKVVITGLGLGAAESVRLVGGALEQRPVLIRMVSRTPTRIDAGIPSATRGSPDEAKASLEVRVNGGATYRFDGMSFIAAREEITTTDAVTIKAFARVDYDHRWDAIVRDFPTVLRATSGYSIDCKSPGTDILVFNRRNGFEVVSATMASGRTDSGDGDENGDAGSRVFTPGYSFGDWNGDSLGVNWGVFRSHTSGKFHVDAGVIAPGDNSTGLPIPWADAGTGPGDDRCSSIYTITSLTLSGPAGLTP
jgi:hypothetical protein